MYRPFVAIVAFASCVLTGCSPEAERSVPAKVAASVETTSAAVGLRFSEPVLACPMLPDAVRRSIAARSGWRVLTFRDLNPDDQEIWRTNGEGRCPGVVAVRFTADGRAGYAVALVARIEDRIHEQLLAFVPAGGGFTEHVLSDPGEHAIPAVVWTAPPGAYEDRETGRRLESTTESVGYQQMEAWAVQFFYKDGSFDTLTMSY